MQGSLAIGKIERNVAVTLILASFIFLSTEHLFHYPIAVLTLMGVYHWVRDRAAFLDGRDATLAMVLFCCIFVPMVLALPDAAVSRYSLKTTAAYLHFLPALLYCMHVCREPQVKHIVLSGVTALICFWALDALWQLGFGHNVLGFERSGAVLTGMFNENQRLGLILGLFFPVVLLAIRKPSALQLWSWLLLVPLLIAIAFSLKRSAWVMLIVGLLGYAALFVRVIKWNRTGFLIALAVVAVAAVTAVNETRVRGTLVHSFSVFSSDFETADMATSRRLTLWRTGSRIAAAHPLNGIGPRGYRHVYRDFADEGDYWMQRSRSGKGQTHPHLMGLEVLIETGLIGLAGFLTWIILLMRHAWRVRVISPDAATWSLVALVGWFPLNTHLAFYGSYWSSIVWLLVAIAIAEDRERPA